MVRSDLHHILMVKPIGVGKGTVAAFLMHACLGIAPPKHASLDTTSPSDALSPANKNAQSTSTMAATPGAPSPPPSSAFSSSSATAAAIVAAAAVAANAVPPSSSTSSDTAPEKDPELLLPRRSPSSDPDATAGPGFSSRSDLPVNHLFPTMQTVPLSSVPLLSPRVWAPTLGYPTLSPPLIIPGDPDPFAPTDIGQGLPHFKPFVFLMGDGRSDEEMFEAVARYPVARQFHLYPNSRGSPSLGPSSLGASGGSGGGGGSGGVTGVTGALGGLRGRASALVLPRAASKSRTAPMTPSDPFGSLGPAATPNTNGAIVSPGTVLSAFATASPSGTPNGVAGAPTFGLPYLNPALMPATTATSTASRLPFGSLAGPMMPLQGLQPHGSTPRLASSASALTLVGAGGSNGLSHSRTNSMAGFPSVAFNAASSSSPSSSSSAMMPPLPILITPASTTSATSSAGSALVPDAAGVTAASTLLSGSIDPATASLAAEVYDMTLRLQEARLMTEQLRLARLAKASTPPVSSSTTDPAAAAAASGAAAPATDEAAKVSSPTDLRIEVPATAAASPSPSPLQQGEGQAPKNPPATATATATTTTPTQDVETTSSGTSSVPLSRVTSPMVRVIGGTPSQSPPLPNGPAMPPFASSSMTSSGRFPAIPPTVPAPISSLPHYTPSGGGLRRVMTVGTSLAPSPQFGHGALLPLSASAGAANNGAGTSSGLSGPGGASTVLASSPSSGEQQPRQQRLQSQSQSQQQHRNSQVALLSNVTGDRAWQIHQWYRHVSDAQTKLTSVPAQACVVMCTVSLKPSKAKCYVQDEDSAVRLLQALADCITKQRKMVNKQLARLQYPPSGLAQHGPFQVRGGTGVGLHMPMTAAAGSNVGGAGMFIQPRQQQHPLTQQSMYVPPGTSQGFYPMLSLQNAPSGVGVAPSGSKTYDPAAGAELQAALIAAQAAAAAATTGNSPAILQPHSFPMGPALNVPLLSAQQQQQQQQQQQLPHGGGVAMSYSSLPLLPPGTSSSLLAAHQQALLQSGNVPLNVALTVPISSSSGSGGAARASANDAAPPSGSAASSNIPSAGGGASSGSRQESALLSLFTAPSRDQTVSATPSSSLSSPPSSSAPASSSQSSSSESSSQSERVPPPPSSK